MTVTSARTGVERAEKALARAQARLDKERAARRIRCCCGGFHQISSFDLVVTHWYVEPHGCTGGDYWREGEWNLVCPRGVRNRLLFDDSYLEWADRKDPARAAEPAFKRIYRYLFKSSHDWYDHSDGIGPNNINYYVDEHRAKFELPAKNSKG